MIAIPGILLFSFQADCSLRPSDWARRADADGQKWTHFDSVGITGGIEGTNQNSMVPTNLVHVVVGPGRGTWDQKNPKIIDEMKNPTSQQVLGRDRKSTKTKVTALARSIDLRPPLLYSH